MRLPRLKAFHHHPSLTVTSLTVNSLTSLTSLTSPPLSAYLLPSRPVPCSGWRRTTNNGDAEVPRCHTPSPAVPDFWSSLIFLPRWIVRGQVNARHKLRLVQLTGLPRYCVSFSALLRRPGVLVPAREGKKSLARGKDVNTLTPIRTG